jgi:hypothetical protein
MDFQLEPDRNFSDSYGLASRGRGVPIGHDGDGERIGFSDFLMRATKRQSSILTRPPRSHPTKETLYDRSAPSPRKTLNARSSSIRRWISQSASRRRSAHHWIAARGKGRDCVPPNGPTSCALTDRSLHSVKSIAPHAQRTWRGHKFT